MLPFLLASACGIIIFSFNIFFVNHNYNKAFAVSYDFSSKSQNRNAMAGKVHENSGLVAPTARPRFQGRNFRSASGDLNLLQNQNTAKNEAKKNNNVAATVPAGNQLQRAEIKKTEPSVNVSTHAKTQNWLIQAGAFSIESSAVRIKDRIVPLGYSVEIVKTGTEKPLFKVIVSAGNSGASPNDALKKLNSVGIGGYIIAGRP
jgi:cell division protein FtsN